MRVLLVGHGRMGRWSSGWRRNTAVKLPPWSPRNPATARSSEATSDRVDVAIDFSLPDAVPANLPQLMRAQDQHRHRHDRLGRRTSRRCARMARGAGIGVLASANFSLGMNIFQLAVEAAAAKFAAQPAYGAWIHEMHHAAKKDAPSGTALMLKAAMERSGLRPADRRVVHAGGIGSGRPHVGFDGTSESVTLTHEVRDRAVFARGALEAAKWLRGRHGWFSMRDMLRRDPESIERIT